MAHKIPVLRETSSSGLGSHSCGCWWLIGRLTVIEMETTEAEIKTEMTVAEALTELKRIAKLLLKRNKNIRRYSSKKKGELDEVEGQKAWIEAQYQSAKDLIKRWTAIKLAMNTSNLETIIEFEGEKFSVAEAILFKQQLYEMKKDLLESFTPERGQQLIQAHMSQVGRMELSEEERAAINLVPELMYSEAEMIKAREDLLNLYSFIDALIESSNHNTVIDI